jgi:hypothetical protein
MLDLQNGTPWETVTLKSVGTDPSIFRELLTEAKEMAMQKEEGKTIIYQVSYALILDCEAMVCICCFRCSCCRCRCCY